MKILTVYDAHVTPGSDDRRFHALAHLIMQERPDYIIQGGDFCTMESLSHWDRDKRQLIEGRRLKADLAAARDAWAIVTDAIEKEQHRARGWKTKMYQPYLVWMEGNHENWMAQYIERNPELDGIINYYDSMQLPSTVYRGISYIPWKQMLPIAGILFTHAPIGRTGPISSKYITSRTLADMSSTSIVFGHTHRRQEDTIARYDAEGQLRVIRATNAGCFFEEWPHYAKDNTNDYWQGVLTLNVYAPGQYDVTEHSLERMLNAYYQGDADKCRKLPGSDSGPV